MLEINADAERFFAAHPEPTAGAVLAFYVTERGNPTSLVSNLHAARENARALRPLISTEMWVQLNVFHNRVALLGPQDATEERLARLCATVKEGCDAHAGITAGTFYRDEALVVLPAGGRGRVRRPDDAPARRQVPGLAARADAGPGSAADASYWTATLRSAAGYQAFRRSYPGDLNPEQVAAFMLCDPWFPRSVAFNLGVITDELTRLRRRFGLRLTAPALERLDALTAGLEIRNVRQMLAHDDLRTLADAIQRDLADLSRDLASAFFGHTVAAAQSQSQT